MLLRDPARKETLARLMTPGFAWTSPEGCPTSLPLFLLEAGDARRVAAQTSCGQDIAADGVFAAAMLAEYRAPLETFGAWFYRRLHWEAGVVARKPGRLQEKPFPGSVCPASAVMVCLFSL